MAISFQQHKERAKDFLKIFLKWKENYLVLGSGFLVSYSAYYLLKNTYTLSTEYRYVDVLTWWGFTITIFHFILEIAFEEGGKRNIFSFFLGVGHPRELKKAISIFESRVHGIAFLVKGLSCYLVYQVTKGLFYSVAARDLMKVTSSTCVILALIPLLLNSLRIKWIGFLEDELETKRKIALSIPLSKSQANLI